MAFDGIRRLTFRSKRVLPDGVFMKCEGCGAMIVIKETEERGGVCKECNFHFQVGARRRVEMIVDPGSFTEMWGGMRSCDPLKFSGKKAYAARLADSAERSGLSEAAVVGTGKLDGREIALGVTDFFFMGGSMGSVVGEKLTRLIELALERRLPLIIVCGSGGGARMDEGMLSLMQMAKTSAALGRLREARMPYISVLTHSSYGGTMASWASLGDVILAEPRAMLGFTGPRVIRETLKVELPPGFQEAEFMLRHGLIDMIVPRARMRETLVRLLAYLAPARPAAADPAQPAPPAKASPPRDKS